MVIILLQSILSAFACAAFSVVFNAPRRELFWCGLNGGLGWLVYSLLMAKSNHAVSATLAAAAAVTLAARLLSYHRQASSTLYQVWQSITLCRRQSRASYWKPIPTPCLH